ncbi:carotenoid oxygenase family protein [Lyngbya sp. CCY1209]|jgi:carotenoid cleavage dioxygenase|uniref:carotenoid oxygenase family protein n=1 Tax=Lyngbya sp. CCY1209 TaxID=2886103 RepID=UPI002D7A269B|nr:carotenoid oxygenase family protein [Lyngbya sp. CCY1209]
MDLPLKFYPEKMQRGEPAWNFESELPAQFGILPRHGDNNDIRWFECPSCFIFHTLNAYEEGDEIVLTACRMKSTTVLSLQQTDDRDAEIPRLHQWRFNLKTGEAKEEQIDDRASDFPRINEARTGRKNRYGYTAKMAPVPMPLFDGLIKYDRDRGTSEIHEFGPERFGGEAVFVPRPGGTAEDEGWLVTFVYNQESNQSEFVVIDAQNVADGAIARVIMPHRVPYGFHGTWVSEEELARS